MMRILAVYGIDSSYGERFADYVNQKEKIPFTAMAFSNLEKLLQYSKEHAVEILLVDVGQMGRGALPVLSVCDVVYMPIREDMVSAAKLEEFDEYLEEADDGSVRDRIQRLRLPSPARIGRREGYLEQLLYGEMGDYVRQLLKGRGPEHL